jgi:plasmid stability protein
MAQLLVRNLDDDVKAKLQRRAKKHGHSTEEEVRSILRDAVAREAEPRVGLGTRIAARFVGLGLKEGEIEELRGQPVRPARFDK